MGTVYPASGDSSLLEEEREGRGRIMALSRPPLVVERVGSEESLCVLARRREEQRQ